MIRIIEFRDYLVSGDDMRLFLEIFKGRENQFRPRKTYDEYYFTEFKVKVDLNVLETLSNNFTLEITSNTLTVINEF